MKFMMSTSTLLYIATTLATIQYIAHSVLFLFGKPKHGEDEFAVIKNMRAHRWNFSGFKRSYWDFYFGYGLLAILWGVIEILLLWQFASFANIPSIPLTPIILILLIANIGHAILTLKYFFLIPAVF